MTHKLGTYRTITTGKQRLSKQCAFIVYTQVTSLHMYAGYHICTPMEELGDSFSISVELVTTNTPEYQVNTKPLTSISNCKRDFEKWVFVCVVIDIKLYIVWK